MPLEQLAKGDWLRLTYTIRRRRIFEFHVEATHPVTTFLVDDAGLKDFTEGGSVDSYAGFTHRREHHQAVRLPRPGRWHLIVENSGDSNTAVHYEVTF